MGRYCFSGIHENEKKCWYFLLQMSFSATARISEGPSGFLGLSGFYGSVDFMLISAQVKILMRTHYCFPSLKHLRKTDGWFRVILSFNLCSRANLQF